MLRIKQSQWQMFQERQDRHCIELMEKHARRYLPEYTDPLAPPILRQHMENAFIKARRFQARNRADFLLFATLWCLLGHDFDLKPEFDWAQGIRDDGLPDKVQRLYTCAEIVAILKEGA